jgi:hypothetical protein
VREVLFVFDLSAALCVFDFDYLEVDLFFGRSGFLRCRELC